MISLKWKKGRQETGYEKIVLFRSKYLKCDAYLIKYNEGDFIPKHIDTVDEKYVHNRINILLKKSVKGGDFICEKYKTFFGRIIYFQPSEEIHSVSTIEKGKRYILSFGWLTKRKNNNN